MVINFDFPKMAETYLHRIGRSGRFRIFIMSDVWFRFSCPLFNIENVPPDFHCKLCPQIQLLGDVLRFPCSFIGGYFALQIT